MTVEGAPRPDHAIRRQAESEAAWGRHINGRPSADPTLPRMSGRAALAKGTEGIDDLLAQMQAPDAAGPLPQEGDNQ